LPLVLADQIFISKSDLSQSLTNLLIRLAAFQNPEFYKAQAMRFSVWNKPRIIKCAENFPQHIGLPRGYRKAVLALLEDNNIRVDVQDKRLTGFKVSVIYLPPSFPPVQLVRISFVFSLGKITVITKLPRISRLLISREERFWC